MTADDLKAILADHAAWIAGTGGKRADLTSGNLRYADLTGATLTDANLTGANLTGANLIRANLTRATLTGANLTRAYLTSANLTGADLTRADLTSANLTGANLTGAYLTRAYLTGATLTDADLLCIGNMHEIRTMQIGEWQIGYTAETLQIGCQGHAIDKWRKWSTDAGRNWIAQMDARAPEWADRNLALVLAIVDANPATPTGHEASVAA